ncbi:uncharacterized protein METZ01_LOCUS292858 [marine metagenome]|uniref:Uncharacterized protein n=1 Tax=marine metagenome TaxID=408172 RepID=A0A382LTD4_9ZZZZ
MAGRELNCGDGKHSWYSGRVANQEVRTLDELIDSWELEEYEGEDILERLKDAYGDGAIKFEWTCNMCHRTVFSLMPIRLILAYSTDKRGGRTERDGW